MVDCPLKSPLRTCAVGTLNNPLPRSAVVVPSQDAKKNSLFFRIGPPKAPPNWLSMRSGMPEPAGVLGLKNRFLAPHLWFDVYSKATPCHWLVPDLVITEIAAPPVLPCSASKLF